MIFQNFIHLFDPFILFILEEYRQESFEILLSSLLKPAIYLKTFSFFLFFFQVLTASHCVTRAVKDVSSWSIKLGAHDHRRSEASVQRIKIKRIIMHPSYGKGGALRSDVAMVELETPARLTDRVKVPCLPKKGVYPAVGKNCYIAGINEFSFYLLINKQIFFLSLSYQTFIYI